MVKLPIYKIGIFQKENPLPSLPESLGKLATEKGMRTVVHQKNGNNRTPTPTPQEKQAGKILSVLSALSKEDVQKQLGEEGVAKQLKKIEGLAGELVTTNGTQKSEARESVKNHTETLNTLIKSAYDIRSQGSEETNMESELLAPSVLKDHFADTGRFTPSIFSKKRSQDRLLQKIQKNTDNSNHYVSKEPDILKDSKKLLTDVQKVKRILEQVLSDKNIPNSQKTIILTILLELNQLETEIHASIKENYNQSIQNLKTQLIQENHISPQGQARLEAGEQIKEVIRLALATDSPLKKSLTHKWGAGSDDNNELREILKMNFLDAKPSEIRFAIETVDDVIRERALKRDGGVTLEFAEMHGNQPPYKALAAISKELRIAHEKYESTLSSAESRYQYAVRQYQVRFQADIASRARDLDTLVNQAIGFLDKEPLSNHPNAKILIEELKGRLPVIAHDIHFDELYLDYKDVASAITQFIFEAKKDHIQIPKPFLIVTQHILNRHNFIQAMPCGSFGDDIKTFGQAIFYHDYLTQSQKNKLFDAIVDYHYIDSAPLMDSKNNRVPLSSLEQTEEDQYHTKNMITILNMIEENTSVVTYADGSPSPLSKEEFKNLLQTVIDAKDWALKKYEAATWNEKLHGPKPDYRQKLGELTKIAP